MYIVNLHMISFEDSKICLFHLDSLRSSTRSGSQDGDCRRFLETRVNFNLKSDAELFAIAKCKTVVSAIEGEVGFRRA
ncbi:hypothetical protein L1987_54869 [Smallanthus sonchifolius]|uniref:Uncharacterized protein n=1 Tax=Smallanthus sonchifolius TaxID=185202 RepID=A0ACB9E8P3_9ASTR|nr:hypothetical protein L1987_54869 [Smallanthus sonchifolius]